MKKYRFDGKVAIVTGAGRGLGRAYALLLGARGCHVVVNDNGTAPNGAPSSENPAEAVAAEIKAAGGSATVSTQSVLGGADAIVGAALESFGRLDILINNAGPGGGGLFNLLPVAEWEQLFDIHVKGTVTMCRAAWPHLAANGAGSICNMSSTASFSGPYVSHYSAAKSAIMAFSRCIAAEGASENIRVNAVMPNAHTRLTAQIPDAKILDILTKHFQPEKVAAFVVWLCHPDCPITGEVFSVGGGRAARVDLTQARGVAVPEDTPEAWAAIGKQLLSRDGLTVIRNQTEDRAFKFAPFGFESASA